MADLTGGRLGGYEITSKLGAGGMATVYRGRQTSIGRDVAIKVIEARLAEQSDFVRRFEREARTVADLNHAHILKVFDYGRQDDIVYLVTELLRGGSLADRLRGTHLPLAESARILEQIASALDYAHRKGIVHRDLKPQNVLFDEAGDAHLTDFGVSKVVNETTALTQTGMAMGTPAYMSPEQCRGGSVDGRSDIYALGVMLFEMVAGRLPFEADTPVAMVYQHLQEPPPDLHTLRPDLPKEIAVVVHRALAKSPDQRYPTAGAFARAFLDAMNGQDEAAPDDAPLPGPLPAPLTAPRRLASPEYTVDVDARRAPRRGGWLLGGLAVATLAVLGVLALLALAGRGDSPTVSGTPDTATAPSPDVVVLLPSSTLPAVQTETATIDARAAALATLNAIDTWTAAAFTPTASATATPTIDVQATIQSEITAIFRETQAAAALVTPSLTPTSTFTPTQTPTRTTLPTNTAVPSPTTTHTPTSSPTRPTETPTSAPTFPPTQTPQAVIEYFTTDVAQAKPGDTVTLFWKVNNVARVTIYRLTPDGQRGMSWGMAADGALPAPIDPNAQNEAVFLLEAQSLAGDQVLRQEVRIPLVCAGAWFYTPNPGGCVSAAVETTLNEQPFERGVALWIESTKTIYVLYSDGLAPGWEQFPDTYTLGTENDPSLVPPSGFMQPSYGIGQVWRTQPNVRERLGWATTPPYSYVGKFQGDLTQEPKRLAIQSIGEGVVYELQFSPEAIPVWTYINPLTLTATAQALSAPTPLPTSAPSAIPATMPVSQPVTAVINLDAGANLNVRSGPGSDYSVLTSLPAGTEVYLLGVSADYSWYAVWVDTQLGWLMGRYLRFTVGDVRTLPVLAPAPTATWTPVRSG